MIQAIAAEDTPTAILTTQPASTDGPGMLVATEAFACAYTLGEASVAVRTCRHLCEVVAPEAQAP
jgi:hypothetical protein